VETLDFLPVVEDTWRIGLRNGTRGLSPKGIRTMHITQKSSAVVTSTVPTVNLADPGSGRASTVVDTAVSTRQLGACPTWCTDRALRCSCDGDHWSESGQVIPTLGRRESVATSDSLDVCVHFDREWHWEGRPESEMDQQPCVLLHGVAPVATSMPALK